MRDHRTPSATTNKQWSTCRPPRTGTLLSGDCWKRTSRSFIAKPRSSSATKPEDADKEAEAARSPRELAIEKTWANTELRAPIDGQILEKNFNVGDLVDPSDDLYKIVDTSHVRIIARVYEEDLPTLRHLPNEKRLWKIDLISDPFDEPIAGTFELVGGIIDPADHTGTVMGTLDNKSGRMNLDSS